MTMRIRYDDDNNDDGVNVFSFFREIPFGC